MPEPDQLSDLSKRPARRRRCYELDFLEELGNEQDYEDFPTWRKTVCDGS